MCEVRWNYEIESVQKGEVSSKDMRGLCMSVRDARTFLKGIMDKRQMETSEVGHGKIGAMRPVDLDVFIRPILWGAIFWLVFHVAHSIGEMLWIDVYKERVWATAMLTMLTPMVILLYLLGRGGGNINSYIRSRRFDVVLYFLVGVGLAKVLILQAKMLPWADFKVDSLLLLILFFALVTVVSVPVLRDLFEKKSSDPPPQFLPDEEIVHEDDDVLGIVPHAKLFANQVLSSGAHGGLVFGVDGPWGVGKSSFLNIAKIAWKATPSNVLVFNFEPMKFASDPDVVKIFLRELSSFIRGEIYAPEFRPLASKYMRMLKAETSFSIPGVRLSLLPRGDTIDELLEELNGVLNGLGVRVIVVIDDLDRINSQAVTNMLFMVRRTLEMSQVTYVLSYDTEKLVSDAGAGIARDYLEKFVNVKTSLYVDLADISRYLRTNWSGGSATSRNVPIARISSCASILVVLSEVLENEYAGKYCAVLGNMRKVKRFVNSLLLVELERVDLHRTDFDRRDLINLMLLSINYPGVFRDIYAQEAEGRKGAYSARYSRSNGSSSIYVNHDRFNELVGACPDDCSKFLVEELFRMDGENFGGAVEKNDLVSRACFNQIGRRNLSSYLRLIVRFEPPPPVDAAATFQLLVASFLNRDSLDGILANDIFDDPAAVPKFWDAFVASADAMNVKQIVAATKKLVNELPSYPVINGDSHMGARVSCVYALVYLLNSIAGKKANKSLSIPREDALNAIRDGIFGTLAAAGIVSEIGSKERGVLGFEDLMLLRRIIGSNGGSQLENIGIALSLDSSHISLGMSSRERSVEFMRKLSQIVFLIFKDRYITNRLNFFTEVDRTKAVEFFGRYDPSLVLDPSIAAIRLAKARALTKAFVIYQLASTLAPSGDGFGCGIYDESGELDRGGISRAMSFYVLFVCFRPVNKENMIAFAEYCLGSLGVHFEGGEEVKFDEGSLISGLNRKAFQLFWRRYGSIYRRSNIVDLDKEMHAVNYSINYRGYLSDAFDTLDASFLCPSPQVRSGCSEISEAGREPRTP